MSSSVANAQHVPWWKEPTKDQWIAWWAAWLGWTLDAFDFTIFLLIMVPIANEFNVPLTAVAVGLHHHAVAAPGRRDGVGLAGRSGGPEDPADDLHPVVLDLQLHRRLLAELRVPVVLPRAARHRHGRRVAGRRVAGDGVLAGALARFHERRAARLLGSRLPAVQRGLRPVLRLHRLARHAVDRHPAGARRRVGAQVRQGAARSGWRTAGSSASREREVRAPLVVIFKRQFLGNTLTACWWMASCMVTYYSIWALFATHLQKDLGLGPVMVGAPLAIANLVGVPGDGLLGLGRRRPRPALVDDHPGRHRHLHHADLPADRRPDLDRRSGSSCSRCSPARCTVRCRAT